MPKGLALTQTEKAFGRESAETGLGRESPQPHAPREAGGLRAGLGSGPHPRARSPWPRPPSEPCPPQNLSERSIRPHTPSLHGGSQLPAKSGTGNPRSSPLGLQLLSGGPCCSSSGTTPQREPPGQGSRGRLLWETHPSVGSASSVQAENFPPGSFLKEAASSPHTSTACVLSHALRTPQGSSLRRGGKRGPPQTPFPHLK